MDYWTLFGSFAVGFIISTLARMNNELRKIRRALERMSD